MDRNLNPRLIFVVTTSQQVPNADHGSRYGRMSSIATNSRITLPIIGVRPKPPPIIDPHAQFAVLFDNLQADIMGVNNRAVLFCACYGHLEFAGQELELWMIGGPLTDQFRVNARIAISSDAAAK